jgi:uncharacterized protein (TIGR01777 family)
LEGADLVVNLAGRSVNCRYTPENKQEIYDSRLLPTQAVGDAIRQAQDPPRIWFNASTATIYRHSEDKPMDEEHGEIGDGFSVDVAQKWETTFFGCDLPGVRKVALRSSIVMGHDPQSAFTAYLTLAKRGLGGHQGDGKQMVSWIHIQDWVRAIEWLVSSELEGIVNVTSPGPLTNDEFVRELRDAAGIRFGMNQPEWMLRLGALVIGTETELILKSRWAIPRRLVQGGFEYLFPTWREAAAALVK